MRAQSAMPAVLSSTAVACDLQVEVPDCSRLLELPMVRSRQLGDRQRQPRASSASTVARVGTTSRSPGRPSQDCSPADNRTRPAQDVHGRLARVLVLGQDGAFEHGNDRLAQYPFMAADNGIRSVTSVRGGGPFQQLVAQGFEGELLHVLQRVQSAGRP